MFRGFLSDAAKKGESPVGEVEPVGDGEHRASQPFPHRGCHRVKFV